MKLNVLLPLNTTKIHQAALKLYNILYTSEDLHDKLFNALPGYCIQPCMTRDYVTSEDTIFVTVKDGDRQHGSRFADCQNRGGGGVGACKDME
jgi:hypothetical protein